MQTDIKVGSKPGIEQSGKGRTNKLGLRGLGFINLFFYIQKKKDHRDTQKEVKKKKKRKI